MSATDLAESEPSENLTEGYYPDPDWISYRDLKDLLQKCGIKHPDVNVYRFWPLSVLKKIMTEERIVEELTSYAYPARAIPRIAQAIEEKYIRVFAVLVLVGRGASIKHFITEKVTDDVLPLEGPARWTLTRQDGRTSVLCTLNWSEKTRAQFLLLQYKVNPVMLQLGWTGVDSWRMTARHLSLPAQAVLPFALLGPLPNEKMHANVRAVSLHPDCHEFNDIGLDISPAQADAFAIKRVFNLKLLRNEVSNLIRFSGFRDKHLLPLLISWTKGNTHEMLFPLAKCSLWDHWHRSSEILSASNIQWMAKQIHGLASALAYIHDPPLESYPSGGRMHGRHGDIKPDNILLFAGTYQKGTLVIADFGLTMVTPHASRKQVISSRRMPACCLRYRPPEFDIRGGVVSSDCDIWSFGCVLLEYVIWTLQGWEARATLVKGLDGVGVPWGEGGFFAVERITTDMTKNENDEATEIKKQEEDGWKVIQDKKKQKMKGRGRGGHVFYMHETVTQMFAELNASSKCTPFFHELLFLVEEHMLIVRPRLEDERISAADLTMRLEELLAKVMREDLGYCEPALTTKETRRFNKVEAILRVQEPGMCLAQ